MIPNLHQANPNDSIGQQISLYFQHCPHCLCFWTTNFIHWLAVHWISSCPVDNFIQWVTLSSIFNNRALVWRRKMYMQCMPYPTSAASHLKCLLPLFVSAYICMCCFYFSAAYVLMCFNFIYVLLCFVLCFYIWFWCMIWCYVVLCIYLYSRFKSTLGLMFDLLSMYIYRL
jgi:hypothetical protein